MKLSIKGVEKMLQNMDKASKEIQSAALQAIYMESHLAMTESKKRCPADKGVLRASGKVSPPEIKGKTLSCELSYGGAASAYALAVHEHLSVHSPPSWKQAEAHGNGVVWHTPGTGPKYLESVMNERQPEMLGRLARRVKSSLGGKG